MTNKVNVGIDTRGLIEDVPYPSRLYDKRVKKVIVVDTETAPVYTELEQPRQETSDTFPLYNVVEGSIEEYETRTNKIRYRYMSTHECNQIVFDIGYTIADKRGNIFVKRRHLIKEIFTDMQTMKHAHYFSKMPEYLMDLSNGKVKIAEWIDIIHTMEKDIFAFNIREVYAYNAAFDTRAISKTHEHIMGRPFNMFKVNDIHVNCLWYMACETLLSRKSFITTAIEQGWMSEAGNIKTSAEMCYRYIQNSYEFEEAHTALEDAIIETQIMARCYAQRSRMTLGIPKIAPWSIVKNKAIEFGLLPLQSEEGV